MQNKKKTAIFQLLRSIRKFGDYDGKKAKALKNLGYSVK